MLAVVGVFVLAGAPSAGAAAPRRYDIEKIVQVEIKTGDQLKAVELLGVTILNCHPGVGPMDVLLTPVQLAALDRLGLPRKTLVDDVQALVDRDRAAPQRGDPFADFFLDYHAYGDAATVGSIVWYMNELVARYPNLVRLVNLGVTLEGRTIWGVRVGNDSIVEDKPGVVYFGAEHAREWVTTTVPNYFATHLVSNYGIDDQITDLVDHVEFFLIPVFNVDGFIYSWNTDRYWRKNRRDNGGSFGVDINRNWAEGWGGEGSSGDPSSQTYRGTGPFSEPETQVLRDFFLANPNVRAQLDIHSYSQLILWPYGYTSALPADQPTYEAVGTAMQELIYGVHGESYTAGPIYTAIYPASGGSLDWTYAQLDILSYSFECRPTSSFPGFELPPDQIIPNNEELLPAMLHLTNSDWVRSAIRFDFPNGLPAELPAGSDGIVAVTIVGQWEQPIDGTAYLHYRYDVGGPFIDVPLTPLGGDAYEVELPATNCASTPEFYFSVEGDGGSTIVSPRGAPSGGLHTATVTTGVFSFFEESLDANPGWTTEGQWAWGVPGGAGGDHGGPDPTSGHSGSAVYGYNLSGDYAAGLSEQNLTSAAVDCSGRSEVRLGFWRWLGVETPAYDHAYVRVSNDNLDWVTVWQNQGEVTDSDWIYQELDISDVADGEPTVYLRWTMGSTDGSWQYCGWNIDDIRLLSAACDGLAGDHNGDGGIGPEDAVAFEACYTGVDAGPVGPGCGVFDFDEDGDVDCADWVAFLTGWSGPGDPPGLESCASAIAAPIADSVPSNRYISLTPVDGSGTPYALRVTVIANTLFSDAAGREKWVGTPDADNTALLVCDPVYRAWEPGVMIDVGDIDIVPGAEYGVEATAAGALFSSPAMIATVALWGDAVGAYSADVWTAPNGTVNFNDISAAVKAFQVVPSAPDLSRTDMHDAVPNRLTNFADIDLFVKAFQVQPYPYGDAAACP